MKTIVVGFLILLSAVLCDDQGYCQNGDNNSLQVSITPLNLIDPLTGVLQFGLQKRFDRTIALSIDYGFRFNKLSPYSYNTERKHYKYSKSKLEIKYYPKPKMRSHDSSTHHYFSIQAFYFPQEYRKENSYILRDDKSYHFDYSDINRMVLAGSVIMGTEKVKGRVTLDKYVGIGIRRIKIEHQTQGEIEGFMPTIQDFHFTSIDLREGTFYRLNFTLGLKVGIIFK